MQTLNFQPDLRPELPLVDGPKEYRQQRALFLRLDDLLTRSGLEQTFTRLSLAHRQIDLAKCSAAQGASLNRSCVLAFRSNIARMITGLAHREFCIRLADSALLQWFLQIGRVDGVSAFAKSSSDRFAHLIDAQSLQILNQKLVHLLHSEPAQGELGLDALIDFRAVFMDSTCLKAHIHYPVDWALLRDATRTLMKATERIRKQGLRHRMPQGPLSFLSEMNTLCMAMTAKNRTAGGKKHRKAVFRQMKALIRRVEKHARRHLNLLKERGEETDLGEGAIRSVIEQVENILAQVPTIIKQAHERIIGGRKVANKDKTLSLYDNDVQVIKRGKSNAEVEFGNNLWIGESREGFIVDYALEQQKTSDAKQVEASITRLVDEQSLPVTSVWGDRGLHSEANEELLESKGIYSGLCPRDVKVLSKRLDNEPELRTGLKRRAGTEARISIVIRKFMGSPARAKGFEHREMMVGWAVLSHNLWKLARLKQAEEPVDIPQAA
ncbi:MAG: hypothetical protein GVY36_19015 [Verrucomicrobia bacterium]|jgi:hypothetical protein|nr:hypothetical protein [Verrucomicrobiota bacterium]